VAGAIQINIDTDNPFRTEQRKTQMRLQQVKEALGEVYWSQVLLSESYLKQKLTETRGFFS
jgi:hypothetical protein